MKKFDDDWRITWVVIVLTLLFVSYFCYDLYNYYFVLNELNNKHDVNEYNWFFFLMSILLLFPIAYLVSMAFNDRRSNRDYEVSPLSYLVAFLCSSVVMVIAYHIIKPGYCNFFPGKEICLAIKVENNPTKYKKFQIITYDFSLLSEKQKDEMDSQLDNFIKDYMVSSDKNKDISKQKQIENRNNKIKEVQSIIIK